MKLTFYFILKLIHRTVLENTEKRLPLFPVLCPARNTEGEKRGKKERWRWWIAEWEMEQKRGNDKMRKKKQQKHLYWSVTVYDRMHCPCLASDLWDWQCLFPKLPKERIGFLLIWQAVNTNYTLCHTGNMVKQIFCPQRVSSLCQRSSGMCMTSKCVRTRCRPYFWTPGCFSLCCCSDRLKPCFRQLRRIAFR